MAVVDTTVHISCVQSTVAAGHWRSVLSYACANLSVLGHIDVAKELLPSEQFNDTG